MAYSKIKRLLIGTISLLALAYIIFDGGQVHPADEYLIRAKTLLKQHKILQAKTQIDLAIKLDPYRIETYYIASILFKDDISEVERIYNKGFALDPRNAGLLNGLGYHYADAGLNLTKALELTRKAVELQPNNGSIVDSLGWAQYKIGDYSAAVITLQKAVRLEPGSAEVRYHLAAAYAKNARREEALIELGKASTLDPKLTTAVNLRNKLRK